MKKALFLDLDHTLVRPKSGGTFPKDATDWEFMPGILDKIKQSVYAHQYDYLLIITNQGGIELGYQTEEEVRQKLKAVCGWLRFYTPQPISNFYYCPTMEGKMRKPNPGMIELAAYENELDLSKCLMIGDMDSDKECARAAGVHYFDINQFLKVWAVYE